MASVGEAILDELKRNRELLELYTSEQYKEVGAFAAAIIRNDIEVAEKALAENDIVQILSSYEKLKGNQ
jgi:hypothetical protein